MATFMGDNYAAIQNGGKISADDAMGTVKVLRDVLTLTGDLAINDVVQMGSTLPPGARVLMVQINTTNIGGTPYFLLGYDWSPGNLADTDYYYTDLVAMGIGSVCTTLASINASPISRELQPILTVTNGTTANVSGTIELILYYV
jgi:hypothetical protein